MSGEPEFDSLNHSLMERHLERQAENEVSLRTFLLAEIDRVREDKVMRWTNHTDVHALEDKALDTALAAQQRAVDKALEAVARENLSAKAGIDKLTDQSIHFVTREQVTELLSQRVSDLIVSIDQARIAHAAVHRADQIAIDKAEAASTKQFASVNEFRAQLRDQAGLFATRDALDSSKESLGSRLAALERLAFTGEGRDRGMSASYATIGAVLAVFLSIAVTVVVAIVNHR